MLKYITRNIYFTFLVSTSGVTLITPYKFLLKKLKYFTLKLKYMCIILAESRIMSEAVGKARYCSS